MKVLANFQSQFFSSFIFPVILYCHLDEVSPLDLFSLMKFSSLKIRSHACVI